MINQNSIGMPTSKDLIEKAIKELIDDFQINPLSYFTESDLKVDLIRKLKVHLNDKEEGSISVDCKRYASFVKPIIEKKQQIYRVHSEVNLLLPLDSEKITNKTVDVGVFKEKAMAQLEFMRGTKKWRPKGLEAVIEIKFIKNKAKIDINLAHSILNDFLKIYAKLMEWQPIL